MSSNERKALVEKIREEKKDEFIKEIATMIWGDGKQFKGLHTEIELLKDRYDRCDTCNGDHPKRRAGDA